MLNEKRVKLMTRMALFEKKEARDYMAAADYSRKDYIGMHAFAGFLTGTLLYLLIYTVVVIVLFTEVIVNLHRMTILLVALTGLLLYTLFIFYHIRRIRIHASKKYDDCREKLATVKHNMRLLHELYKTEEAEHETAEHETAEHETAESEPAGHEIPEYEAAKNAAPEYETTGHEMTEHETSEHETQENE